MFSPMTKRPRHLRRIAERETAKLVQNKKKLAALESGGAPDRAIGIPSASVVETHARAVPCPLCEGAVRVLDHTAEEHGGARLRVAHVTCTRCGAPRAIYYRIVQPN